MEIAFEVTAIVELSELAAIQGTETEMICLPQSL
jgi:hypothetical protein